MVGSSSSESNTIECLKRSMFRYSSTSRLSLHCNAEIVTNLTIDLLLCARFNRLFYLCRYEMLAMDVRLFRISTCRSFSITLADFRQPSFTNPFTLHRLLVQKEFFLILSRYHPSTSTSTLTMAAVSELVVIWNCCVRFFILICHNDIHFRYHAATHC